MIGHLIFKKDLIIFETFLPLLAVLGSFILVSNLFKIDIISNSKIINCCAGGRYDRLISDLGSKKQVSAVGAAFNL